MVLVQFEEILPQAFREGVIRLSLLNEMRKIGTEIQEDLARPTKTWSSGVRFNKRVSLAGGEATVFVETEDDRYVMVSRGTPPHVIPKDPTVRLRFPGTFSAKTIPGTLEARSGAVGNDVFATQIEHPGSEPRNFDLLVKEIWEERFPDRIQEAFDRSAERTGYVLD